MTKDFKYRAELIAAETAARQAGAAVMELFKGKFDVHEKSKNNPVTTADLEANRIIREKISVAFPDDGWLSEEDQDNSRRLRLARVWVVDPIDGTRDYLRGRTGWCVSVALIEDRTPLIGVLDAPQRGEHWTAERGKGAWRNGERLQVSSRTEFIGARVPADQLPQIDSDLVAVAKPNSIALRIAMVAAGEADLVATLRWGFEWDIAAAALIAEEAGATVTGALGQPLTFNTITGEAFGVLVATPGIHAAAAERLRKRALAVV